MAKMSFRISIVPTKLYFFNFGVKFKFSNKISVELKLNMLDLEKSWPFSVFSLITHEDLIFCHLTSFMILGK